MNLGTMINVFCCAVTLIRIFNCITANYLHIFGSTRVLLQSKDVNSINCTCAHVYTYSKTNSQLWSSTSTSDLQTKHSFVQTTYYLSIRAVLFCILYLYSPVHCSHKPFSQQELLMCDCYCPGFCSAPPLTAPCTTWWSRIHRHHQQWFYRQL